MRPHAPACDVENLRLLEEPQIKPLSPELNAFDRSVTTWEGSRREQMRRWAALPLESIIRAIEEIDEISAALQPPANATKAGLRVQDCESVTTSTQVG